MTYIVYDFHGDGKHRGGQRIKGTTENLAAYIARIEDDHKCTVTDVGDNFILNTLGNMIFTCHDKQLLKELVPILIPYQIDPDSQIPEVEYI